jgi:hypothetical protein
MKNFIKSLINLITLIMCGFTFGTISATLSVIIADKLDLFGQPIPTRIMTISGLVYIFGIVMYTLYSHWSKYVRIK